MRKDMLICRCLEFFALQKIGMTFKLLSYSCLARVFMDPRNKSEDDCSKSMSEDDGYKKNASENDERMCVLEGASRECVFKNDFTLRSLFRGGSFLLSSLRGDNRGQAIFELEKGANRKIPGIFLQSRKIGMTFIYCLLSTTAHAECTPAPDCANMGYTETSCEGDSLKCPFDISKLFCIPCDSSYKYDCNGDNMTGGVGDACGGKYASCACSGGGEFNNGSCPQSCTVGMIYYSDKSCSSNYDSSKTAIGVVVKDNELVLSQKSSSTMTWGTYGTDISGLTNYSSSTDAKADYNGKSNTAAIIAGDSGAVAAKYCNDYTTAGTSAGDWYLPAAGELYSYVYGNYNAINTAMTAIGWTFDSAYFWSSSEYSSGGAWTVGSRNGYMYAFNKTYDDSVSCFLDISGG